MHLLYSLLVLQSAATAPAEAAPPAPPPPACATAAHAAFDFWVGEWQVYPNGGDRKVAESRIERLHNGCAIRERSPTTLDIANEPRHEHGQLSTGFGLTWSTSFDFIYRRKAPANP